MSPQPTSASPDAATRTRQRTAIRAHMEQVPLWLIALALSFLVLMSGSAADVMFQTRHLTFWSAIQPSDWVTALVAAVLFYRVLLYEQQRRRAVRRRLEVIAEINHHIRNAVYAISLSTDSSPNPELVNLIQDSVKRIDWTLKEVLPKL